MAHALRGIIFSEWDDWFLKLFKANVKRTNQEDPFHRRMALAIIIGFAIIRCFIAFSMELGTDEAYYWLYSQDIKWNYYDHPPMIAIWIRLFTVNLLLQDI